MTESANGGAAVINKNGELVRKTDNNEFDSLNFSLFYPFQTGAERCVDHFLCTFCGENFTDPTRCDRHIDRHLTHQNCSCCDKPVILIGSRLFELHVPQEGYQKTNQAANATKLDSIVSIDEQSLLLTEKCDRDVAKAKPRKSYKRRSKHNVEYVEAIDIVDSLDAEDLFGSNDGSPAPLVAQVEYSLEHDKPSQIANEIDGMCKPSSIKCDLCSTQFKIKHTLTRHLHQKHNIPPEYKCEVCGIVCKKYQYLKDHRLTHGAVKRWICSWCGAGYHLKNNLTEHENCHTGARPHKCASCDKSFSRKALLRAHMVQHTGKRPFNCTVADCQRTYAYYTDLTRHKRGAHGIMSKPHACKICDRIFYERKFLRKHMEKHMLPSK